MYINLKRKREEMGFTQEYMASKLGFKTKSAYCMKEKGIRKFTIEEAKIISNILKEKIDDIFSTDEVVNANINLNHNQYFETG